MKNVCFLLILCACLISSASLFANTDNRDTVVMITGANRGLGLEMARAFTEKGYTVYGTARKPEKASELKEVTHYVLQLDVTDEHSIERMAKQLKGRKIDILINNAGYFGPNLMTEEMDNLSSLTREEMELCINVNTLGPIFVTQALLPNLKKSDTKKIINISTRSAILSKRGYGRAYGYKVSKAALNMVTVNMAGDPSLRGFTVVSLAPGHNKTDMGTERGNLNPAETMKIVRDLILDLKPEQSGGFWYYDGSRRPW